MSTVSIAPRPLDSVAYNYNFCTLTQPDKEIRILTLYPGLPNQPIKCELQSRRLITDTESNETHYEALSYSWGADRALQNIEILHSLSRSAQPIHFMVRPNLYSALEQLRYPDRSRELWVDAICINQEDNQEKNLQIPLVPKIYSGAASVCVWLGPISQDSWLARSFIQRLLNLDDTDRTIVDDRTEQEWPALASLMKREWFNRRWCVTTKSQRCSSFMSYVSVLF